jgi:hypothetical protein
MPSYDQTDFDPPAPVALVSFRDLSGASEAGDVRMLIDTGADATVLPEHVVRQLGLYREDDENYELLGFGGARTASRAVQAEMRFLGRTFRGRYLVADGEWGIIGRNVLNNIRIALDGPARTWETFDASPRR